MTDESILTMTDREGAIQKASGGLTRFAPSPSTMLAGPTFVHSAESLVVSPRGGVMIVGWVVDTEMPIDRINVVGRDWSVTFEGATLARVRRTDVEAMLGTTSHHSFGYFGFSFADEPIDTSGDFRIEVCLKSGWVNSIDIVASLSGERELRDLVLSYLAGVEHFGNQQIGAVACVDGGIGSELIAHNRALVDRIVSSPYVEHFGPRTRKHGGSIVVCLYGKSEYLFLQNALFSRGPGIEDYEFIYICNSPEIAEFVLNDARIGSRLYDIDQTVVILPGNAGFGAANNVAAGYAETPRLLIVNPDVFPYDFDWAQKHSAIVADLPRDQTRLFGAPLYYDNGSLMHGGMYFELDKGPMRRNGKTVEWELARVEHYGKGAPPDTMAFLATRPVPAVTGAFISCDRAWFERLEGFTEDYIFGHYEDADLCLKSTQAGTVPWLHNLKLWHLEGHGSTRLPAHEGGSIVNRWLFSANWASFISANLRGPHPTLPALRLPPAAGQPARSSVAKTANPKQSGLA